MTWKEYIALKASELGKCTNEADLKSILKNIQDSIDRWKWDDETRKKFWRQLTEEYKRAPKPLYKEAVAAENLIALMDKAEELLAQAEKGKQ